MDHKRLESISRLTREQLSRPSEIFHFGLDVERDILRGVTAEPRDKGVGTRLTGADHLTVHGPVLLPSLRSKLKAFQKFASEVGYRDHFPWIDNVAAVTDPVIVEKLDAKMAKLAAARGTPVVWLAPPSIVDWDRIEGFRHSPRTASPVLPELSLSDYLSERPGKKAPTAEELRKEMISCVSAENDVVVARWPVHRCIAAELDWNASTYVLSEGAWYRIDASFRDAVEREIDAIKVTTLTLPDFRHKNEQNYNSKVAAQSKDYFVNLDRKLVMTSARNQIEACDLYGKDHTFVHVKRGGGSTVLSHLFMQGLVSAQFFMHDLQFRQTLAGLLPSTHAWPESKGTITPSDFEVAYAVVGRRGQPLELPFFSKVSLRNTARSLREMGYRVTLTPIVNAGGK